MKLYYIETFGCQINKLASERIEGDYQARGYQPAKSWKEADEIVINTCSVRQRAEDRVKGFILNVVRCFETSNQSRPKIILTGCMTHFGKQKLLELLPEVDEVLPISEVGFNLPAIRRDKIHAFVQISEGCNSFCSYCIVPYSRGREKSRPMKEILNEIKELANRGYKEITLLGQNVNSYGLEEMGIGLRKGLFSLNSRGPATRRSHPMSSPPLLRSRRLRALDGTPCRVSPLVQLLKEISRFSEINKISFMTSNPWDFGDDLIDEIARNEKIDRFIHLPVQSGSNKILKLMNRGYTRENYLELVGKLRKRVKDVQMGTDIIVGFPTETEKDFQETVDLAERVKWVIGFVAQYSPRPGTAAVKLYKDDVPAKEKKRRWEILDKIINKDNLSRRPKIR